MSIESSQEAPAETAGEYVPEIPARPRESAMLVLQRGAETGRRWPLDRQRTLTIGRSTVRYRIRRIQEISGLDLTDTDTRFQLQLAARAWSTIHALNGT